MNDSAEAQVPGRSGQVLQRPLLAALVIFCIGSLLAGASAVWQARVNAAAATARFDTLAVRTAEQIAARVQGIERGLRGARGAVVAAGTDEIDRRRFRAYGQSRDIAVEFPGAHGFGVLRRRETRRRTGLPDPPAPAAPERPLRGPVHRAGRNQPSRRRARHRLRAESP
jgi:CHASE1-domain containing sensor protein